MRELFILFVKIIIIYAATDFVKLFVKKSVLLDAAVYCLYSYIIIDFSVNYLLKCFHILLRL
ncbi:MAG: hypothetical protein VB120_04590 [Lachnospiraceae bacterium]|nr:hypothetical protein [Lachnospiraceae bacterium]